MRLSSPASPLTLNRLLVVAFALVAIVGTAPATAEDAASAMQQHLDAARKARTASDWETANAEFTLALRQAELLEPGDSRVVRALEEASRGYRYQKEGTKAIELQERAVELQRSVAPTASALAESLYRLGKLYYEFDNKEAAEIAYREALEIREPSEPDTARVSLLRRDLSKTILALRPEDAEAEELLQRDLDQSDTSNRREQLGRYFAKTDNHEAAVDQLLEAIDIEREQPLPSGRRLVSLLTTLATQYQQLDRYVDAEGAFLEAVELRKADMGAEHPYLAFTLRKLAKLYMEEERWIDAEATLLRARDLNEAAWGQVDHACSCTTGDMLTEVRNALGLGEASRASKEALSREIPEIAAAPKGLIAAGAVDVVVEDGSEVDEEVSEADKQIRAADEQARRLRGIGEIEAAKDAARKALAIREETYGVNSLEAAAGLERLGKLLKDQRRTDEAVAAYEQRLTILETELDAEHPRIARAMKILGQLERDRKNFEAAEHYMLLSVNLRELIGQRIEAARNLEATGNLNLTRQFPERAAANFTRAIELWEDFAGAQAPEIMRNRARMAQAFIKLGRFAEAEAMLNASLEIERDKLLPDAGLLIQLLQPLKTVLEKTERTDQAAVIETRLKELRNLRKPVPRNPAPAMPSSATREKLTQVQQLQKVAN